MIDIIKASRALKKSGDYSHVQGSISFGNQSTRLEGSKGTNQTLKNIKRKSRGKSKKGVLVKFPKKKQDLRLDLPTIGFDTFKYPQGGSGHIAGTLSDTSTQSIICGAPNLIANVCPGVSNSTDAYIL